MKLIDKIKKDRILALKAKENEKKLSLSTLIGELDRKDKEVVFSIFFGSGSK